MKTDGIRRLVSALGNTPYQSNSNRVQQPQDVVAANKSAQVQNDAVKVSVSSFNPQQQEASKSERSEKFERIKNEVANGTYQPKIESVATSLASELGF